MLVANWREENSEINGTAVRHGNGKSKTIHRIYMRVSQIATRLDFEAHSTHLLILGVMHGIRF